MNTAFSTIPLDRIRYSLVWESRQILHEALRLHPQDHVMVITSAGCNVLNTLLHGTRKVSAVDINPIQNNLLRFKTHIIQHFPYQTYHALLGLAGREAVARGFDTVAPSLDTQDRDYWGTLLTQHPDGLFTCGQLEGYLQSFYEQHLQSPLKENLKALGLSKTIAEQVHHIREGLEPHGFREIFIEYFNNRNLSKGRDEKLFKYAQLSGGELFYQRFVDYLSKHSIRHNFPFQFLFYGLRHLEPGFLPPAYQAQHYEALRAALPTLEIIDSEAVEYLLSPAGETVTKAAFSNIFEYVTQEEFQQSMEDLRTHRQQPLRFAFWNLLNEQGTEPLLDPWRDADESERLSAMKTCFYFGEVRVFDFSRS